MTYHPSPVLRDFGSKEIFFGGFWHFPKCARRFDTLLGLRTGQVAGVAESLTLAAPSDAAKDDGIEHASGRPDPGTIQPR
jgi:hypothetical protein